MKNAKKLLLAATLTVSTVKSFAVYECFERINGKIERVTCEGVIDIPHIRPSLKKIGDYREINRSDYSAINEKIDDLINSLEEKGLSVSVSHTRTHGDGSTTSVRATYTSEKSFDLEEIIADGIEKGFSVSVNHTRTHGDGSTTTVNATYTSEKSEKEREDTVIEIRYTWEF